MLQVKLMQNKFEFLSGCFLGYFLLADLYNRLGNQALSLEYARKGKQLAESNTRNR